MKKTIIFDNYSSYDNWYSSNEKKYNSHCFLLNRVIIIKETKKIHGRKFNGFSSYACIKCKLSETALRRFIKEINSNGYELSANDIEVEKIGDEYFYLNYTFYHDKVEEEITKTIETTETTEKEYNYFPIENFFVVNYKYLFNSFDDL